MSILSGVGVKEHGATSLAVDGTETTAGLSTALAYGGFNVSNPLFEILDLAGDAFVVMDDGFRIVLFNRAAERVFQYEAADIIGQTVQTLLPERFRHGHGKQMTDFRDHTKGSRLMGERRQIIGLRRNGAEFPAEASIACVSLGGETAYVVVLRDITERTLAEQQTARLGRIIEQSINEIYVFNAESRHFVLVNRGTRENLGYTADEMLRMTPMDLKSDYSEEDFAELVRPLQDGSMDEICYETLHHRRDGSTYEVEIRLQLLRHETPPVFVAIARDITERSRAIAEFG